MDTPSRRRRASWRWLGPALAAFAVALYLVALPNGWTRDDRIFILGNPLVRDLGKLPAIFTTDYWGFFGKDPLYRPLTVASMSVQYALAGNAPWSYRIVDALLHGCTVWLLLTLLRGGLRLPPAAAGVGALIFAAHPACSEAVLQVVGRADIFVALAALAALRLHLADYRLGTVGPALLVPALLVLLTLGLLSKETAVAIPPLLLATDLARGQARRFMVLHAATFAPGCHRRARPPTRGRSSPSASTSRPVGPTPLPP